MGHVKWIIIILEKNDLCCFGCVTSVAYLGGGGGLRLGPLSADHNFYNGIFGRFTNFFRLEHQNSGIH